ncbi:hypothetical protein FDECE_11953 [Fusarium decemcellulare]|nr:hypothetical protein FDECE_11953 [Fusarium decemcellulare]
MGRPVPLTAPRRLVRPNLDPHAGPDPELTLVITPLDVVPPVGVTYSIDVDAGGVKVSAPRVSGCQVELFAPDRIGPVPELASVVRKAEISPFSRPGSVVFEAAARRKPALRCFDGRRTTEKQSC